MRILFIITDLDKGGAETNLYQLITRSSIEKSDITVVSLIGKGYYSDLLSEYGVEVYNTDLKKKPLGTLATLVRLCKKNDIISCWMYHSNLLGYIALKLSGKRKNKKLIWNIRNAKLNPKYDSKLTIIIDKLCAKLSNNVDCIAYNGEKARVCHEEEGYTKDHSVVLDNGCDAELYKPRAEIKDEQQLKMFSFANTLPVIISVGRYHPIKDHKNFITALGILKSKNVSFRAVFCGEGMTSENREVVELCKNNGITIGEEAFLLGRRDDINLLLDGSDIFVLHSASEAFPNALAQAMASGCLCVATDVGCAREIMGNDSFVIKSEDPVLMADKIIEVLKLDESKANIVKAQNRQRIIDHYSVMNVISKYEELYK